MLKEPPRDDDGDVLPHNHEEILNEHSVIRRISDEYIITDSNGNKALSSMAYRASSGKNGGMSIDLKDAIEADGIDAKSHVTNPRWFGSVIFQVSDIRNLNFKVGYDPSPDNLYHGEVWGNFSRSNGKKFKNLAAWFVPIPNVNII